MPESTAHDAIEDTADAYKWIYSSLPDLLGRPVGSILLAGSSAGAYLALNTAISATKKPHALLLIYGMLNPAGPRYTTPGMNIFGRPLVETGAILEAWPMKAQDDERKPVSAYPVANPAIDPRLALVAALHIDALLPDYMTGIAGLARQIATEGVKAIPEEHRHLFPLHFGDLTGLPRIMLLHGINDTAVPLDCSTEAEEKLKAAGAQVLTEYPPEAEHGFDARAGSVNVETSAGDDLIAVESLRRVIRFLEQSVTK